MCILLFLPHHRITHYFEIGLNTAWLAIGQELPNLKARMLLTLAITCPQRAGASETPKAK
jgi:hypothetical protein